ncbi:epsin-2-like [Actinia tenebrosa]|uniref:Epsin-2-like n=1 Tax=Actinia tenebrosa TaxID=6105 RepID=A0A6P8ICZ3_ACTTE|nr:epsin-2-like [Actinia tenebrosa]
MSIRRQMKNVVKNYSNSEVKVREATSNDPWGPSSSLMSEIADATYNVVAFSEIMAMIWKRLNDHGKNWRHVYKALVLLDYIIKTGSERVAQQCRENIFVIQTLKDFQFIDKDGKDQGMNVREKAKQLVALLKDEERLKNERQRALKAKERFAQASGGIGSDSLRGGKLRSESGGSLTDIRQASTGDTALPTSRSWEPERKNAPSDIENCRPANANEEELQLQLALALSKQEADETTQIDQHDDERLKMALSESQKDDSFQDGAIGVAADPWGTTTTTQVSSTLQSDPWGTGSQQVPQPSADPWGTPAMPVSSDPWGTSDITPVSSAPMVASAPADPWGTPSQPPASVQSDPWGTPSLPVAQSNPWSSTNGQSNTSAGFDPFSQPTSTTPAMGTTSLMDGFGNPPMAASQPSSDPFGASNVDQNQLANQKKNPEDFLGGGLPKSLVDLDLLASTKDSAPNPFLSNTQSEQTKSNNPFLQEKPQQPTLNQLRHQNISAPVAGVGSTSFGASDNILLPAPLIPSSSTGGSNPNPNNPFM